LFGGRTELVKHVFAVEGVEAEWRSTRPVSAFPILLGGLRFGQVMRRSSVVDMVRIFCGGAVVGGLGSQFGYGTIAWYNMFKC
jgi:hypothetical protein